jgi:hypothetical protein
MMPKKTEIETPRFNLDTAAVLVEFSAPVWTARKLDRTTTDEVVSTKNAASKDAARVNKHLLAGRTELETISKHVTRVRTYVYENTLPWSDAGLRLLPTAKLLSFSDQMERYESSFGILVDEFVEIYPSLITAQAMALGDMFRRDDYPTKEQMASKFSFRVNYMPVPAAGDFRIDVGNEAAAELKAKLESITEERIANAMLDVRERLAEHLKRMSDRLTTDNIGGEEKTRRFHDTLVTGAMELCDLTKALNITHDPQIEMARKELERCLVGITAEELRKNPAVREDTKKAVDAILDKFTF